MIILYNLLLFIPFILSIPISYIFLPKDEFFLRFAFKIPNVKNPIWIHCASLGELNAIKPLIKELIKELPDKDILITTTSRTGFSEAKSITNFATYLPIDFYPIMKRFIKKTTPSLLIIAETELWPNLFELSPSILMVNARISDKTFKKYKLFKLFFQKSFRNIKFVCAQSEENKKRFISLGIKNVKNFGNLKFAVTLPKVDRYELRRQLNYSEDDFIIVWGSSRPGEEKLLSDTYPELKNNIPNLKIIVAPRHLKRIDEVKSYFNEFKLYSENNSKKSDILIVDKMGVLSRLYSISDIAIIGGSFYDFGGHNPLEAVFYKIPVIIGNYHSSCKDTVRILKNNNAIIVSDKSNLLSDIIKIYKNRDKRIKIGIRGFETMKKNSQSLIKTLNCIKRFIRE